MQLFAKDDDARPEPTPPEGYRLVHATGRPLRADDGPAVSMLVLFDTTTKDFPGRYVVREMLVRVDGVFACLAEKYLGESIREAREACAEPGRIRMGRTEQDEPQLLEVWV